ncbi:MAG: methyltransferase type 11 [Bacteroidetes bacterium SW_9_63_38]|nr:MAG: methyltransferase type 11 [Bacteroidetes bacterium SW_9_63_38]
MSSSHFDFSSRSRQSEWMDDPDVSGEALTQALRNLRQINVLFGGYRASATVLTPLLRSRESLRVLDVGSGTGDYPDRFVRWGQRRDTSVEAVGVDLNPVTVGRGRAWLDETLPPVLRPRVRLDIGDALALPYDNDAFDVTHAALFLHHIHGPDAVQLLHEMNRVSRLGVVINDLHRHPLAYAGIWVLSRLLRMSPMVQHDGPISVLRGFRKAELFALADRADLPTPTIRWHWAFRWTLSTLPEQ